MDFLFENEDQFPLLCHFIMGNYRSPYVYRVHETGIAAVIDLL